MEVMRVHNIKKELFDEHIRRKNISDIDLKKFLNELNSGDLRSRILNFNPTNFPMSLSIIGKCISDNAEITLSELTIKISNYNNKEIIENYIYLRKLSEIANSILYVSISKSGYTTIGDIVSYDFE
jgi:hypothetical protein